MELVRLLDKLKLDYLSSQLDTVCEQAAQQELDYKSFLSQALNAEWQGIPARVHFIPEYYSEDLYSCEYLKAELGIFQQPDECIATRNEYHDDYHYSSIIATTEPERIRAQQRVKAGLFSINGVSLEPLELTIANGRKLVMYRAEITARAIRAVIARP